MTNVSKFYHDVIDDVITGLKDIFNDEGIDLQVLEDLKKLWTAKLAQTHVFDPEPSTNTAAQYLNLVQRSQGHAIPAGTGIALNLANTGVGVPVRPIGSVIRTTSGTADATAMGLTVPGSLASLRVPVPRLNPVALAANRPIRPLETGQPPHQPQLQPHHHHQQQQHIPGTVTSLILPAQPQLGKPQNPNVMSGIVNANAAANMQAGRTVTAMPANAAPQLATLPSGLTGHLVQIGQQTFLVPQPLTAATAVRQPGGGMHFTVPQFMNNPHGAPTAQLTDISQFKQTQVDGGNDSDDDKFCDTPASQPPSVRGHHKLSSRSHYGDTNTPHVHGSDLDDDDDDDDDDLVPATPGLTPPSSVRSHYQHQHGRHNLDTPINADVGDATPLPSAPPTPMSPPSGVSRQNKTGLVRRQTSELSAPGQGNFPKRRRRQSPYPGGGDTETEVDDDEDDRDYSAIMSAMDATPSGQHSNDDDEDGHHHSGQSHKKPKSKQNQQHPTSTTSTIPTGTASSGLSHTKQGTHKLMSPTAGRMLSPGSELGMPGTVDDEADMLKDEQEEEEEEEEEPLNSEDDVSDEEPEVLFESDNVIVCQYDKIHRSRNKWRFYLKDGIMSINARDYLFQKAIGEAEW